LADAEAMQRACARSGVGLWVHENWRWQTPIRAVKSALAAGAIGRVFRARITYLNSFPVFENQPFLKQLYRFILTDMGCHLLDTARFLFGEPTRVYAQTTRIHRDICGEDVATVMYSTNAGCTVLCEMSYASRIEHDRFPETFIFVEGEQGAIELGPDYWLRVTTASGTVSRRCPPPYYAWADPRYAVVHASIVDCHRDLLSGVRGAVAETTVSDNLRTLRLVDAAYESALQGAVISMV
jgi:predicted dehydrogenase